MLRPGIARAFHTALRRRGQLARDLGEELEQHFALTIEALIRQGLAPEEAQAEARRRLGGSPADLHRRLYGAARQREVHMRLRDATDGFIWDLRHAWRRLRHAPAFTLGVVLTFALGIGASATAFTLLDRLFLQAPAHLTRPDELRLLLSEQIVPWRGGRALSASLSYPDVEDLRRASGFTGVAAYSPLHVVLGHGPASRAVDATLVSGNFFSLLGVTPELGRFFTEGEDRVGGEGLVVLSHHIWRSHFAADPGIEGQSVELGHGPYTVIGVAPAGFTGATHERTDLWLPLLAAGSAVRGEDVFTRRGALWVRAVARLRSESGEGAAIAEATTLHRSGRSESESGALTDTDPRIVAAPLIAGRHPQAPQEATVALWIGGVSAMLLLIVCANIANLLLARGIREHRETAIRVALGGGRGRLLRAVLVEALLLATLSAGAAMLVAAWGGEAVRAFLLPDLVWSEGVLSPRLLGFVLALTVAIGMLSGVLPAFRASRAQLGEMLRSGGRAVTHRRSRLRDGLLLVQTAFAVILLVGAGLFVRSLHAVASMDLGLEPAGVMLVRPVFEEQVDEESRTAFFVEAAERLRRLPAVAHATATLSAPFYTSWSFDFRIPGRDSVPTPPSGGPYFYVTDHDFFDTMRMRVVRGRTYGEHDDAGAPRVVVINEAMKRLAWPDGEALGECIVVGGPDSPCATVIGIVQDARRYGLIEPHPQPQVFLALGQGIVDEGPEALLVRARGEPRQASEAIRSELLSLDSRVRSAGVRHLPDLIAPQTRSWRLGAIVFSVCGVLALIVAGVGLYGVLAFSVAQRVQEIGIRNALGAGAWRIVRLITGEAGRFVVAGVLAGGLLAWLAAPRVEALLYGTAPRDPAVFGGVALLVLAIGAVATAWPTWRASRVSPQIALRNE